MSKFNRDGPLDSRDDRYYDCIVRNPFYPELLTFLLVEPMKSRVKQRQHTDALADFLCKSQIIEGTRWPASTSTCFWHEHVRLLVVLGCLRVFVRLPARNVLRYCMNNVINDLHLSAGSDDASNNLKIV